MGTSPLKYLNSIPISDFLAAVVQLFILLLGWLVASETVHPENKTVFWIAFASIGLVNFSISIAMAVNNAKDKKQIIDNITGGDNYCYVEAITGNARLYNTPAQLFVMNGNGTPLDDVRIGITEVPPPNSPNIANMNTRLINVGTVLAGGAGLNMTIAPGEYSIQIWARNVGTRGVITERLRWVNAPQNPIYEVEVSRAGEVLVKRP